MPVLMTGKAIDTLNLIGTPTDIDGVYSVDGMLLPGMPQEILVAGQVFGLDEVRLSDDGKCVGTYYRDIPYEPRNIMKDFINV